MTQETQEWTDQQIANRVTALYKVYRELYKSLTGHDHADEWDDDEGSEGNE